VKPELRQRRFRDCRRCITSADSVTLRPAALAGDVVTLIRKHMDRNSHSAAAAARIVRRIWWHRGLTLWLEMFVGLPLFVAGWVALSRGLPLKGVVLLLTPVAIALPLTVHVLFSRGTHARALIVWVRKFHQGDRALLEQRLLEHAVVDWGRLITLSDSSVNMDVGTRMMLTWQYGVAIACCSALVAFSQSDVSLFFSVLAAFGIVMWHRYSKRNTDLDAEATVARVVTAARARLRVDASSSLVLHCSKDGDDWRQAIIELSGLVDAAVVSVSETSANVDWEIEKLVSVLGADKVIVLTDGRRPIPPSLSAASVIPVPPTIGWWLPASRWREASLAVGSAVLARGIGTAPGDEPRDGRSDEQPPSEHATA
jgi:hypothetical protein